MVRSSGTRVHGACSTVRVLRFRLLVATGIRSTLHLQETFSRTPPGQPRSGKSVPCDCRATANVLTRVPVVAAVACRWEPGNDTGLPLWCGFVELCRLRGNAGIYSKFMWLRTIPRSRSPEALLPRCRRATSIGSSGRGRRAREAFGPARRQLHSQSEPEDHRDCELHHARG